MSDEPFEPYWEKDGAKLFDKFDPSSIETPCYVIDMKILENNLKILKLMVLALALAARNFSYSGCWELSNRIKAAPKILSLITLLSQSMASWVFLNNWRTRTNTK